MSRNLGNIPVFQLMPSDETFMLVVLSVIDSLLANLIDLNAKSHYRLPRLETAHEKIHQVEQDVKGYIPEAYQNSAEKFLKFMYADLNSLKKKLPEDDKWLRMEKETKNTCQQKSQSTSEIDPEIIKAVTSLTQSTRSFASFWEQRH